MATEQENPLVPLICPSCGSVLIFQVHTNIYKCVQGHQYTSEQLDTALIQLLKRNLQSAIRQIQEREILRRTLSEQGHEIQPAPNAVLELAQSILQQIGSLQPTTEGS